MIKALFTYDYGPERMALVRQLGYEVLLASEKNLTATADIAQTEVLVCYAPFKTLDIGLMPRLRWIQLSSIGVDQVPAALAQKARVTVTNNRGGYSVPIGEWIVHKVLEIYKQSRYFYENQQQRTWQLTTEILELGGRRVGFIGTGTIAQEAARRLAAFDMELTGFNTTGRSAPHFTQCFPITLLDRWIHRFDVVVVAVPGTPETEGLLNRAMLRRMKPSAVLINVSRGSVLDEGALVELLREGRFMGVALDVFQQEPLSPDNPLWGFSRVYVTPHNCWVSERRNDRRFEIILENLRRYKAGEALLNQVNLEKGY